LASAEIFKNAYGTSKIFLATDGEDIVAACQSNATKARGFDCHVADIDRSKYSVRAEIEGGVPGEKTWIEHRLRADKSLQQADLATGCIIDWELLAECGCFVGDFSRQFFRVPVYLHIAKTGTIPPMISPVPFLED
jgi:hypothetical protein